MRRLALSIAFLTLCSCVVPASSGEDTLADLPVDARTCKTNGACLDDGSGAHDDFFSRARRDSDQTAVPGAQPANTMDGATPSASRQAPDWLDDVWHPSDTWWMCEFNCEGWMYAGFVCASSVASADSGCPMPNIDLECTLELLADTQDPCRPDAREPSLR